MDKIATVKNKVKYAEWIAMVEACRNSGLPITTWCKEKGADASAVVYSIVETAKANGINVRDYLE